ncbi:hypothetical protein SEA_DALANDE_86 [Gordonia phage DalanDe]|nr:hypothetical protein SEA_DALANDE_86 [Gordonia phage DalanDe]
MLDRTIVLPVADQRLVRRMNEQWYRAFRGGIQTGRKYEYPCWVCGEIGIMGKAGFGAKGLVRPRNMMHAECFEGLDPETRARYKHTDTKHILRRYQRHRAKKNLDRVAIRERTNYAAYYAASTSGDGKRRAQGRRVGVRKRPEVQHDLHEHGDTSV